MSSENSQENTQAMHDEVVENVPTNTSSTDNFVDFTDLVNERTTRRDEVQFGEQEKAAEPPKDVPGVATFDTKTVDAIKETTANAAEATTKLSYDSSKLASTIVDMVDMVLTTSAPYIYTSFISKDERHLLKILALEIKQAKIEKRNVIMDAEQKEVFEVYCNLEQYEELVPLSQAEKHSLVEPLAEVLKDVNYQTSPKNTLLIACAMIAAPRIIPLVPMMFKAKK
jgi:hypothetical protein